MKNRSPKVGFFVAFLCFAPMCCIGQQVTFTDVTTSVGVDHVYGNAFNELGGGATFCDINGDGFDDLALTSMQGFPLQFYLSDGNTLTPHNLLPDSYADTTETKNIFFIDYDNDGDQDLFVTSYLGGSRLFQNDDLIFTDVTVESGIDPEPWKTFVSAWGDFDRDGWLDLIVANRHFPGKSLERNFLYRNLGDGTFEEVAFDAGVANPGLGNMPLGISFVDFNNDQWPDIFIAIDKFFGNRLFVNNGDGTFDDMSEGTNFYKEMDGMCIASGDYDNDGDLDVYVTNAPQIYHGNELYQNKGDGTFHWAAIEAGVRVHKHGWGSNFFDYDNDGWLDLFVCNSDATDSTGANIPNRRNPLYQNQGDGTFEEMFGIGIDEDTLSTSYGTAIGDFNDDGFYDIVVLNNYDPNPEHFVNSMVYQNNGGDNNWIKIQLEGTESNRNGIGTWIEVQAGGESFFRYTTCGDSYGSQNSLSEIIGIGSHEVIDSLKITWPSGIVDAFTAVEPNQRLNILEGSSIPPPPVVQTMGLFQNDTASFNGYTLFAPMNSKVTYLIDNCGAIINTWTSEYLPGASAYLLEDGRLLRAGHVTGTPFGSEGAGGKIEIFDWDGNLTWSYGYVNSNQQQHHDLSLLPNGNILLLAWEKITEAEAIEAGRNPATVDVKMWSEKIIEVEPVGSNEANIIWEWRLWDHLVQDFDATQMNFDNVAEHPELVDLNFLGNSDGAQNWVNLNAIDYNAALDQVLLSAGNFNEIWIIDHATNTAEAAGSAGDLLYRWGNPQAFQVGNVDNQKLYGQHDAHWISAGFSDEGKIMVFNNGENRTGGLPYSSVDVLTAPLEMDGSYGISSNTALGPEILDWTYVADSLAGFYANSLSGAQLLPNGNLLICEGTSGQLFEIDSLNQEVWSFIIPVGSAGLPLVQSTDTDGNEIFRSYRYGTDYPAFEDRDLTPGILIELEPWDSLCIITEEEVIIEPPSIIGGVEILSGVQVVQNPVGQFLQIENLTHKEINIQLLDATGKELMAFSSADEMISKNIEHLAAGLYIVVASVEGEAAVFSQKVIKT